jgi:transposase
MVMYDWLDDICDDGVLAHPLKVKAIADAKIKTDKIDATVLAHLLRADLVPEAWAPIRAMTKANANVKLLKTIPGIGEFFARLIDAEIDDISRIRTPKKLAAYAGLVPSAYSSGGKTYHGKIIKQGNKWLRSAFVETMAPAIASDAQLRAQYEHLKIRGTNKARVAIARKLLTIAVQILRDQRAYEPRGTSTTEGASTISRLS